MCRWPSFAGRIAPAVVSFDKCRAQHGGMNASLIRPIKAIEEKKRRLKRLNADLGIRLTRSREALEKI